MNGIKTVDDLEEDQRQLQARLAAIEHKRLQLLQEEGKIRTEMQHVENQLYRLKQLPKLAE